MVPFWNLDGYRFTKRVDVCGRKLSGTFCHNYRLAPQNHRNQTSGHNRWISLSIFHNIFTYFQWLQNILSQRAIFQLVHFCSFHWFPVFRAGLLDCRLLDTSILSSSISSPRTPILIVTYTLLVDPSNIRRRSIVSRLQVSTSSQRGTS